MCIMCLNFNLAIAHTVCNHKICLAFAAVRRIQCHSYSSSSGRTRKPFVGEHHPAIAQLRSHANPHPAPSRSRLASLYSDFRSQRRTNPDGYEANASAWQRALRAAAEAGLLPTRADGQQDRFVLHSGDELAKALQTQDFGRPLAIGAVVDESVRKKDLIPLKDFLDTEKDVFAQSWLPTPWEVVSWTLRSLGILGGDTAVDKLVTGDFVIRANVEV